MRVPRYPKKYAGLLPEPLQWCDRKKPYLIFSILAISNTLSEIIIDVLTA